MAEASALAIDTPARRDPLWARVIDHPVGLFAGRLAIICAFLGLWQWGTSSGYLAQVFFSSPQAIFRVLQNWVVDGSLWRHLGATAQASGIGYVIGVGVGVGLGMLLGFIPTADKVFSPFLTAFYSLPKIALAPLFVLLFGIGLQSKIVLVALTVFFLLLYSALDGFRDTDQDQVDALKIMGATRWEVIKIALLPACLPRIFTGMRISVRHAFTAAILGEVIAGNQGLGYLISLEAGMFRASGVLAAVTVLMICSVLITELLTRTEVSAIRWRI